VSIRFKSRGKLYFFSPNGIQIPDNTPVVVETSKGLELGECAHGNYWVEDERIIPPIRPVIRIATEDDLRVARLNKEREKEAFAICQEKIAKHGLDMKLVDVECNFEGNKILFFFASEGRVDFRELVKDLASVFRTRIELRQIGVRDEAKMLGGLGICGRPFCCSQFLEDFQPVSTKMAKTQSMSLNPAKISGACGRLMCCLRYEQAAYEDLVKGVPKNGAFVETPDGYGNVTQVNLLRQKVKVRLDGEGEQTVKNYDADEVAAVPGGRPKAGEPLPSVLKLKPKPVKEPEEPEEDPWAAPVLFAEDMASSAREESRSEGEPGAKSGSHRRGRGRGHRPKNAGDAPRADAAKPETAKAPAPKGEGEAAPSGKSGSGRRRNRSRAKSSAGGGESTPKAAPQSGATAPGGQDGGQKSASGSGKRHRRYRGKPKAPGGQAPSAQ